MLHYASGATAIEAYWKSVAWPGEGVFIGEPLASPFAPSLAEPAPGKYELRLHSARDRKLQFEHSASPMGPFRRLPQGLPIKRGANRLRFTLPETMDGYIRLNW
jgi:hypothetical protein